MMGARSKQNKSDGSLSKFKQATAQSPSVCVSPAPPPPSMYAMPLLHVEACSWRTDGPFRINHQKTKQTMIRCSIAAISRHNHSFPPRYTQTIPQLPPILPSVHHGIFCPDGPFFLSFPCSSSPPLAVSCHFSLRPAPFRCFAENKVKLIYLFE